MGFRVDCYDTLIKNGHIYDPERGVDMIGHIGILEPNIATIMIRNIFQAKSAHTA